MLRYKRAGLSNVFSQAVLTDCEDCYLPTEAQRANPGLADPVCIIEREAPARPLPPTFLAVGGRDPLKEDNRRMAQALRDRRRDRFGVGASEPVDHSLDGAAGEAQERLPWGFQQC